jgi:hypothetical protein
LSYRFAEDFWRFDHKTYKIFQYYRNTTIRVKTHLQFLTYCEAKLMCKRIDFIFLVIVVFWKNLDWPNGSDEFERHFLKQKHSLKFCMILIFTFRNEENIPCTFWDKMLFSTFPTFFHLILRMYLCIFFITTHDVILKSNQFLMFFWLHYLIRWTIWYLNEKLIFLQVVFGPACINHEFKTVNSPIAEDGFWKKPLKTPKVV